MAGEQPAGEVFGLLSDEIRLDVLRTVAEAQFDEKETGVAALSFSELYDRIDVDNTSKLSYHLGELTGTFLRKHEDGYAFTHAGEQIVRFLLAENYRSPAPFDPIETAGSCLVCGGSDLQAELHDQYFLIRCPDCDTPVYSYRVRPAQVRSREGAALLDAVVWEQAGDFLKMRQGVCPDCAGPIETEVMAADERVPRDVPVSFGTLSECSECLRFVGLPLPYAPLYHPESLAFHWEHGVDVLGTGLWEFHDRLRDGRWTDERVGADADADDADRYRIEYRYESATLRVYLDETATVTRTERVRRTERDRTDRRS